MSLPSADATLTLTVPASTPMSPVPGSPFAKMVLPRAALRVFMYEPRCSITAGGRSRNSEWLRSRDNLSRGRSAGRLPPGIDMSAPPRKRIVPALSNTPPTTGRRRLDSSGTVIAYGYRFGARVCRRTYSLKKRSPSMHAEDASGSAGAPDYLYVSVAAGKRRRRKVPLCEPPHRRKSMSMAVSRASATDTARWTHANAPDPLFPGPVRGAQFHASGQALRRVPAFADQRHHRVGARTGRRPFSTQAAHCLDRARQRHPPLSRPHRPKRGARARGRAGAGRCATGEFRASDAGRARAQSVISIELIAAPLLRRASDFAHGGSARTAPFPPSILKN